jgi:hypothetical protein
MRRRVENGDTSRFSCSPPAPSRGWSDSLRFEFRGGRRAMTRVEISSTVVPGQRRRRRVRMAESLTAERLIADDHQIAMEMHRFYSAWLTACAPSGRRTDARFGSTSEPCLSWVWNELRSHHDEQWSTFTSRHFGLIVRGFWQILCRKSQRKPQAQDQEKREKCTGPSHTLSQQWPIISELPLIWSCGARLR